MLNKPKQIIVSEQKLIQVTITGTHGRSNIFQLYICVPNNMIKMKINKNIGEKIFFFKEWNQKFKISISVSLKSGLQLGMGRVRKLYM